MGTDKGSIRVLFSEFSTALSRLEDKQERNRITEYLFSHSSAFKRPGMTSTGGKVEGTVNIERDVLERLKKLHPQFYSNLVEAHAGVKPEELKIASIRARLKEDVPPAKVVREYNLPEFVQKRLGVRKKRR